MAVLVIEKEGVITSIHSQKRDALSGDRVTFAGSARVSSGVAAFSNGTIVGIVDDIVDGLCIEQSSYEVSVKNIGATSVHDMGLEVTGHSMDVCVFLALLSVSLQLPIRQDCVFTGHMATPKGHLGLVSGIPEKVRAAARDKSIRHFVYPAFDQDSSMESFAPKEHCIVLQAFQGTANQVKAQPVKDISELLKMATMEEDISIASLRSGFYSVPMAVDGQTNPTSQVTRYLLLDNEKRFWRFLERHLLERQFDKARSLLSAFVDLQVRGTTYPKGLGQKLLHLLNSMPPNVKRKPEFSTLLAMKNYFQLGQYAEECDYEDLKAFFEALFGGTRTRKHGISPQFPRDGHRSGSLLQHFLEELSPENIAKEILIPIDTGRASYTMDSVTVEGYQDFLDSITGFYAHLLRHMGQVTDASGISRFGPDALDLAKRAFSGQGGEKAAYSEATGGTRGGLRHVFDAMTQRLKTEERDKYVRMVLKTAIDPLDFESKTAVIKALIKQVGLALPEGIRSQPPERFAADYEEIVHAYSQSLEKLTNMIKLL